MITLKMILHKWLTDKLRFPNATSSTAVRKPDTNCECCDGSGCECCDEGSCQFKPLSVEEFLGKGDHNVTTWKEPPA